MVKDNKEIKETKETKEQTEEKKSNVKSGSKCSCGCIPPMKTK